MTISVTSYDAQVAFLDVLVAAMGVLDTPNVRLTRTLVVNNLENTLATYTAQEADYTGYALATPTWGLPYQFPDGIVRVPSDLEVFAPSGSSVTNTIYNTFINATGGMNLLAFATLPAPRALVNALTGLPLVVCLPWATGTQQAGIGLDVTVPNPIRRSSLAALTAMAGPLHSAKAHLIKSPVVLGPSTSLATLVAAEATYDGYAAQTIATWLTPIVGVNGLAEVSGALLRWAPTGSTTPNTIYGVFVTDSASSNLYFSYNLDSPIPLSGVDSGFYDSPTLSWGT